jgi:hypothetical protein
MATDYDRSKKNENVDYFKYLVSLIINYARYRHEFKSRFAMAQAAFNKKTTLFTSKFDSNLRKKLVKCYIRNIALYGAETWTLRAADQKYLEIGRAHV